MRDVGVTQSVSEKFLQSRFVSTNSKNGWHTLNSRVRQRILAGQADSQYSAHGSEAVRERSPAMGLALATAMRLNWPLARVDRQSHSTVVTAPVDMMRVWRVFCRGAA